VRGVAAFKGGLAGSGRRSSLRPMVETPESAPESAPESPRGSDAGRPESALDRPVARVVAFAVFLGVAALLAWIHRDDLFPPEPVAAAAGDPVALCFAERAADIDRMQTEGTIGAAQARLFKSRAQALCQDQFGRGSGPPPQ